MLKRILFVLSVLAVCGANAIAQDKPDELKYVLLHAEVVKAGPLVDQIQVEFGKSFPKAYQKIEVDSRLGDGMTYSKEVKTGDWLIESLDFVTGKKEIIAVQGLRVTTPPFEYLVFLKIADKTKVDAATHKVRVSYMTANFPDVLFGEPKKAGVKKLYGAAKGKDDADIYLAGNVVAAEGAKPKYSIDSKFGYLKDIGRAGAAGIRATLVTEKATDVDPDSITVGATYRKPFSMGDIGLVLRADPAGGEFDREGNNRNFLTSANVKLVLPSARLGESEFATIDLVGGYEAGNNFENSLVPDGIGGFWRWFGGAGAYFVAKDTPVFESIEFSSEWRVRLPRKAEIFNPGVAPQLSTKARHHVDASLDFMFSKALGLSVSYEYGALPPSFEFMKGKITAGFKLKMAQTNK